VSRVWCFRFCARMNYESNNSKCRFTKLLIDNPKLDGHGGLVMQTTSRRTISTIVLLLSTYTRSAEYVPLIKVHVYGPDYIIFVSMNGQMDGRLDVMKTNAERTKQITYIWKSKKHCTLFLPEKLNRCGEKDRCITCDRGAAGRDDVQDNSFRKW